MEPKERLVPPVPGVIGSLTQNSVEEFYSEVSDDGMWVDRSQLRSFIQRLFQSGALTMQAYWELCEYFEM